jgi:hypothetical protein
VRPVYVRPQNMPAHSSQLLDPKDVVRRDDAPVFHGLTCQPPTVPAKQLFGKAPRSARNADGIIFGLSHGIVHGSRGSIGAGKMQESLAPPRSILLPLSTGCSWSKPAR